MTAAHLAGVLEAIAVALRGMPQVAAEGFAMPAFRPTPAPPPAPPSPQPYQAPADAPPAPDLPPAGDTMSAWLATYRTIIKDRGYQGQTLKNRGASIQFIDAALGSRRLREIKPHEIAKLLKGCSPHKAGRVLGELRDVYTEAIANGEAEVSPAAHVKPPKAPGLRKRLRLETWQAMLALAQTGTQRWVPALLMLALATGQRRADLAKMRFDDVTDGCLRVEQQKKAGKPVGARVAIPLTLQLNAIGMTLGQLIEHCRTIGKPGATLLRQSNGRPIEMSSLSARFRQHIVAVCGKQAYKPYEWPSLHEVRSLSARTYIDEGMQPSTVQTLLGHKHLDMTEMYLDDRGLTAADWKTVDVQPA